MKAWHTPHPTIIGKTSCLRDEKNLLVCLDLRPGRTQRKCKICKKRNPVDARVR